ncbi:6-phospho-3-hexuloisomerase [Glutamicibacter ardleyensis]|uniref:3-hexulose-6-phosphate isomerase n=1 Tax=Glutamicibacter ardleyensis TaxID=225894 RepID=A0ABQ2DFH5_9MICC|nr:6-phospho-3-hexuloisomerase [Glutamicibacter ardleyensis]GGJ53745.1 3-hexulose-6-phosphate isomerase [Glutamicibacter ardleyensis]
MNTMAEPIAEAISQQDVLDTMDLVHSEIEATVRGVKPQQVIELAAQLRAAPRVFVAGAGRSGLALRMAAMRLMHLGLAVHVAGDATTPAIADGDLLLVASGSGTTAGVVQSVNTARGAGARIAAITTDPSSPIGSAAHVLVEVPAAGKTDHGSSITRQYSGSLFEQALFLITEIVFHTLWNADDATAQQLWQRHANLE